MHESDFCFMHDPETTEEAARARQAGRLNRRREATLREVYDILGVHTIEELQRYLEVAGLGLLALDNSVPRNRALISLVGAGAKLIEAGELAEKLESIKSVLQPRRRQDDKKKGWWGR